MATWNKIKFFWDNIFLIPGSALTADSTASGYAVANLYNMLEINSWKAANTTTPMYISFDAGSGKISNGDFETGDMAGWSTYVNTGTGAAATFAAAAGGYASGSYKGTVTITNGGTGVDNIQLIQQSKTITAGKKQYVKFAAKCDSGTRDIDIRIIKGGSPYTNYTVEGAQVKTLTTGWQVFDLELTANITATDAGLRFLLGGSTVDVDFDIICWWEEGAVPLANALVLHGHNLSTIAADTIGVHYSDTNFAIMTDAFTPFKPMTNGPLLEEFTSPLPHRHWRWYITGTLTAAPEIQIAMLCNKAELDYASTSFDPHGQNAKTEVNITQGGYVSGIFTSHIEREMSLSFQDADAALYAKVKAWWEGSGMKNFFLAWENANSPDDVFLMRPEGAYKNPLTHGGLYRDITINLKGRKA